MCDPDFTVKLLCIDTSTLLGSVALFVDGALAAEVTARVRGTHSEELLPMVDSALALGGCALDGLDAIAVGIGPGSFTGVRIGVSLAKGLAFARDLPLWGVTSLEAMARAAPMVEGWSLVALDARRDELYAALWRWEDGARTAVMEGLAGAPERIGDAVDALVGTGDVVLVTDAAGALVTRMVAARPWRIARAAPSMGVPLARLVGEAVLDGAGVRDDGTMEPCYLRGADAKLPGGATVRA